MVLFENIKNWGKMLDDFRQTDVCKTCVKDGGKNIDKIFYKWLIDNYDIPRLFIIPDKDGQK